MLQLAGAIAAEMLRAFFADYFFLVMCLLVITFIRSHYRVYSELQEEMYGSTGPGLKQAAEKLILTGLVTGFAVSFLTVAAGVTVETDTVRYLFYIMCLLMLFDIRFVSFPYAAGLLAAASYVFDRLYVNVPSLLCLAAVLQMLEAFLVYINRKSSHIPVYIHHDGEIAGAFLTKRFWIIPVVFLTYLMQPGTLLPESVSGLALPFAPRPPAGMAGAFGLDCMMAMLLNSDISIATQPEKKSARNAAALFAQGCILLVLALISRDIGWVGCVGAILCIAGREGIYMWSVMTERNGTPLFSAARRGLRVLDVLPGSNAQSMGMMRGDIILSINNMDIQTEEGIAEALKDFPVYTWIKVLRNDEEKLLEYRCYPDGYNRLGIITVPREKEITYRIAWLEHMNIIRNIVRRFRKDIDRPA
ncbi:MAG TPA: PDZ domain-containing protein [Clostridiales bacterium]|nr:PDZ domain-containing protein [Clostridiales bacterium]HPV01486.1 PDZ domain-containing protein [Clostridiales bacterium]